jgi:hypothetical protein
VRFDSSVDPEEEDHRTACGVKLRRQRKEERKEQKRFTRDRMEATLAILQEPTHFSRLILACADDALIALSVDRFLAQFVDNVTGADDTRRRTMLTALHGLRPQVNLGMVVSNRLANEALNILGTNSTAFFDAFSELLPAAAVTSGPEEESPPALKRSRPTPHGQ